MNDEESIFGTEPERLMRLMRSGLEADESDVENGAAETAPAGSFTVQPGTRIGRYKLLHMLGEGGMGIVYLAEQQGSIRRRVALKVIKPGMDSKRVIARFEAERQALAMLDHPNIAHVYDGGTTELGRPYFVMEYVKGLSITEYCDHHRLTIEDRLGLFLQVCHAIHHAHQKGIIHRDIKPSNIVVSTQDNQAVPKIIDFGVAKAIGRALTDRTIFTEDSQLLGTPEYMSPEQVDMANEDIDTRSDIYSLGVLLYVLLTGVLPFEPEKLRESGIENIRKTIRETDPKTPSTRLKKLGDEARKVAQSRRTEVATLAKCLHKELEWIPLKAMRKERTERYRSASELADDIENYLNGVPLIAGPTGTGYKVKKFVRRNRVLVGGVTAVIVVLVAGVIVSTMYATRLARALDENQLITDFLENDVLGSADKATFEEARISYMLDAASKSLDVKFKDKPLIQARLCRTLGWMYRNLGEYDKAEQHVSRVIEIYRKHYGEVHPETRKAMGLIGWIHIKQGRYREMERLYRELLEIKQREYDMKDPLEPRHSLAVACSLLGKYQEAELLFNEILESAQAVPNSSSSSSYFWPKYNLATLYVNQGRYKKAERLYVELQADSKEPAPTIGLATIYQAQGQYAKAEPLFDKVLQETRQLLGDEHLHTVLRMHLLAQLYVDQNRYEEAQTLFDEALSIARRRMRPDHPKTLDLVNDRAVLHIKLKQYDQAEKLFDEALKGRRRELGDDHPETLETINDLGILRRQQKHYKKADELLNRALEGRKTKLGPNHPHTLQSMHELAILYKEQDDYDKAESLLSETVEGRRLKLGDTHPHTIESINNLIDLYEAWNKPEKAEEWRTKLPQTEAVKE